MDLYIHSPIRLHGVLLNYLSTETTYHFITFKLWRTSVCIPRLTTSSRAVEWMKLIMRHCIGLNSLYFRETRGTTLVAILSVYNVIRGSYLFIA
jgi:hypothetical protein